MCIINSHTDKWYLATMHCSDRVNALQGFLHVKRDVIVVDYLGIVVTQLKKRDEEARSTRGHSESKFESAEHCPCIVCC